MTNREIEKAEYMEVIRALEQAKERNNIRVQAKAKAMEGIRALAKKRIEEGAEYMEEQRKRYERGVINYEAFTIDRDTEVEIIKAFKDIGVLSEEESKEYKSSLFNLIR